MIVFTSQPPSNRLLFVLQFMFAQFSQISYRVTQSEEEFSKEPGAKINYSNRIICSGEICIQPSGFLEEKSVHPFTPEIKIIDIIPILFPSPSGNENSHPFDIFSAVFYLLSRYEEYISKAEDKWGRFPAKESVAYKNNFLHLPVVDIWLTQLMKQLAARNPQLTTRKQTTVSFTYDVDVAYAYKGRELTRQAGSALKDMLRIKPYNLAQRTAVLAGYLEDPFDTYHYIKEETINPVFFFLLSEQKTKYDRNINPKKKEIKDLIKGIKTWSHIGIHPSFYSSEKEKKLTAEKKILENIASTSIHKSRQHYLKFKTPHTFRSLLKNGIKEDYSMSYAETPGFRAGTCTPFYFFDIEKDETTSLQLFPACIMESTFRDDLIMPAEKALPYFKQYFDEVNKVKGHFISIWHNDTLAANNKQHFRWLHQQILQYIRSHTEKAASDEL